MSLEVGLFGGGGGGGGGERRGRGVGDMGNHMHGEVRGGGGVVWVAWVAWGAWGAWGTPNGMEGRVDVVRRTVTSKQQSERT